MNSTERQQATKTYFNLFDSRSLEAEVKAVVAEAAHLWMVSVVAHADNGNLAVLYQLYQFLHSTSSTRQHHTTSVNLAQQHFSIQRINWLTLTGLVSI